MLIKFIQIILLINQNLIYHLYCMVNSPNIPCPRAAHTSCSNDNLQLIIYDGNIGSKFISNSFKLLYTYFILEGEYNKFNDKM
jgi:hypothetical protein